MQDDSIAKQALEGWGATVVPIATSDEEECDWLATLDGCRLLVEEKFKLENPAETAARAEALRSSRVHGSTALLAPNNRLSAVIGKAANQLASSASKIDHDVRIVWATAIGMDAEAKHQQLLATLYGSTTILELSGPGEKVKGRKGYFVRHSVFYRYRDTIDGAVVGHLRGHTLTFQFCLNTYSQRYGTLRNSPFAAKCSNEALVDPFAQESEGRAFIADTDVDRRDESAVLQYLQQKYKKSRLMTMDMHMASAYVAVPVRAPRT